MMKYQPYIFVIILAAAVMASRAQAGTHEWGIGARYRPDHTVFEELPFGDNDIEYGLAYECHDNTAFWQIAVTYAPEATGTNGVDSVITPQLNLVFEDSWLRLGLGVLGSYVQQEDGDDDWTDPYWQFLLGIAIPMSSLTLSVNAYYTFEDWGDLDTFDTDDIGYGAWLMLAL